MGASRRRPRSESSWDQRVRDVLANEGATAAATLIIRTYGPDLLGYLWMAASSWGDGDELFSEVCVRIWRALPAFRFECSVRAWVHVIARNRVRAGFDRAQRRSHAVPVELAEEIAAAKTTTIDALKDATRRRLERLRETLDEDDRTLLLLRVDRELPWRDIAHVMSEPGEPLDRAASRLRKRFERVKQRLRRELVTEASSDERGP
jgi:RNA polymerase sigma-70 factor, ECF subfamily